MKAQEFSPVVVVLGSTTNLTIAPANIARLSFTISVKVHFPTSCRFSLV